MTEPNEEPGQGAPDGTSEFLRVRLTWLLGMGLRGYRLIRSVLAWLRRALWNRSLKRLLGLALLLASFLVAGKAVPVVYGRFALAHAAGDAARQLRMKGEDRILRDLRRAAAELGLTEGATQPDAFQVAVAYEGTGVWCTVSFDFVHEVDCYGFAKLPVTIRGKALRAVLEPQPGPDAMEPEP